MLRIERCDDLPLIGQFIKSSNLVSLFEDHYKDHGHWKGVNGGKTIFVWLLYILSESDHRLSHVEEWCDRNIETLGAIVGDKELRRLDLSDDRLGRLLDRLGDDEKWMKFECDFSSQMVRSYSLDSVYKEDLSMGAVRLDSFNIPQHRKEDDFFRRGYSKQRRKDRPFCKAMMTTLENGNFPLTIQLLAGNEADDPNYLPAIKRVKKILGLQSRLYVADSKIGSYANRLALALSADYYLCPLNGKQCTQQQLLEYIEAVPPMKELPVMNAEKGNNRTTTYFYELGDGVCFTDPKQSFSWNERRILVHSVRYAADYDKGLNKRLDRAEKELNNLLIRKSGRKVAKTTTELKVKVAKVLQKHKVVDFFTFEYQQIEAKRLINKYKKQKPRIETYIELKLIVKRNEAAIELQRKRHGWCIYGTNLPASVSPKRIIQLYHDQYKIEHVFDRLINQGTKLLPVFLKKENRIKALTRLLAMAIQFSMIIQHQLRQALKHQNKALKGGYANNKTRTTHLPTTSMILRSFRNISVAINTVEETRNIQMPKLNQVQNDILKLLAMDNLYSQFCDLLESG